MQVLLFTFIFLFRATNFFSATDDIRWSADRKLEYSDFSGPIPSSSPWVANTSSNIYFSYDFNNDELHDITVYSSFTPSKSWMKKICLKIRKKQKRNNSINSLSCYIR